MAAELRDIRSAAIDGRMHNAFFQKEQLKSLHDILSKNITEIQDQIARDHRYTQAEASVEYWLALRCIAEAYKSIDPKQHLQAEYAIAKSKDASDAREPVGIVIVEPAQHTFFYSLISALVPALVHGNCIIVQVCLSIQIHGTAKFTYLNRHRPRKHFLSLQNLSCPLLSRHWTITSSRLYIRN